MRALLCGAGLGFGLAGCPTPPPDTIRFTLTVPANTPVESTIHFQSGNDFIVPMVRAGARTWTLTLARKAAEAGHPWMDGDGRIQYSFTRGSDYFGGEFFSDDPDQEHWHGRRAARFGVDTAKVDSVARWRYFPADGEALPTLDATLSTFVSRISGWSFQAGIEIADYYTDSQTRALVEPTSQAIARTGASWVQIAPPQDYVQLDPLPTIGPVASAPQYTDEQLGSHVANLKSHGFKVLVRIQLCCRAVGDTANRSAAWWNAWFSAYRDWLVHQGTLAANAGVDALLIDWSGNFALPGEPSVPADAQARWETMLTALRGVYRGRLGIDTLSGGDLSNLELPWPYAKLKPLVSRFDFLGLALWHSLSAVSTPTQAALDGNVETVFAAQLDGMYQDSGLPIVLSGVAYRSHVGGAKADIPESDPVGLAPFSAERVGKTVAYDGLEQAMIFQSVMKAIARRAHVVGVYPFHYHWLALPLSPDYSIRGKAAERVVTQWYSVAR